MKLRFYLRGLGIGILVTALIMGISGKKDESLTDEEIRTRAAMLGMVDGGTILANIVDSEEKNAKNSVNVASQENIGENGDGQSSSENSFSESFSKEADNPDDFSEQLQSESKEASSQNSSTDEPETTNESQMRESSDVSGTESDANQTVLQNQGNTQNSSEAQNQGNTQNSSETQNQGNTQNSSEAQNQGNTQNSSEAQNQGNAQNSAEAQNQTDTQSVDTEVVEMVSFQIQRGASSESISYNLANEGLVEDADSFNNYLISNGYSQVISTGSFQIPRNADWLTIAEIITRRR